MISAEIERLFAAALELSPEARAAFLERACADPALRREVESLLVADAQAAELGIEELGDTEVYELGDTIVIYEYVARL